MEPLSTLATVALVVGALFLLASAFAFSVARRHRAARDASGHGRVILSIEDGGLVDGELTSDRMQKLAGFCAAIARRVFGEEFDFTVESIARLDRAIAIGWADVAAGEIDPLVVQSFGAYIGEVLVRRTRGRWVSGWSDNEPATILMLTRDDEAINVSPILLAQEKFEKIYRFDLAIAYTALEQKLKELQAV